MSNSDQVPATKGHETTPIKTPSEPDTDPITSPDPLLGSGSFIDTTNGAAKTPVKNENNKEESNNNKNDGEDLVMEAKRTRPSWLPENWDMILRKRTSGATEGTVDRYYIAPSGQRLRSKKEVQNFLETGSKRKKPSASSGDVASPEGSAPRSKKKTIAKKKVHAAFTFNYKNPPEKVSWCLSYATEEVWSPVIDDWHVPLATKQEWASIFNRVSQS